MSRPRIAPWLLSLWLCLPAPALAEPSGTVDLVAGAYCVTAADGTMAAPLTQDGQVDLFDLPYPFHLQGDDIAAFANVGIGVVVQLHDFRPDEVVSLRVEVPDRARPEIWTTTVNPDGRFWFGQSPDAGDHLPIGRFVFVARHRGQDILRQEFQVRPPTLSEAENSPCTPAVAGAPLANVPILF